MPRSSGTKIRVHCVPQQFRELGFEFVESSVDGLALQLFEVKAKFLREHDFNAGFELAQKLLYFWFSQYTGRICF